MISLLLKSSVSPKSILMYLFPGCSVVKNPPANASSIPGSGRASEEGNGNPLYYSCLGNPMDRGDWWASVQDVTKESDTTLQLNDNNKWC